MRRLYLQVYLAFLGILVVFAVLSGALWFFLHDDDDGRRKFEGVAEILGKALPSPDRPVAELEQALARLHMQFGMDLKLSRTDGEPIAAAGDPIGTPPTEGWKRRGRRNWTLSLRLPDGRLLTARHRHPRGPLLLWTLGLLALATAIGAYPLARRVTRRLERLQARVEQLGSGQLSARVEVEGKDEVAELARSFNHAAERIERLVNVQRSMLASASHELRSPLTRIRMAIELLAGEDRPELRIQIARDIAELDDLIDEILLAARLETIDTPRPSEDVDLLALSAEEGARVDGSVTGVSVRVKGDPRMLRRMVRNLFDNARRHGHGTLIEATVEPLDGGGARLLVEDRGPGVPEEERERIFEPFYRPAGMREGADRGVGLGLALVRQIARHHHGEARCLERVGGGTRLEITLGTSDAGCRGANC
ncbi:MAG: sensor histidine kinase [Gammaproteobacteria bacterium]